MGIRKKKSKTFDILKIQIKKIKPAIELMGLTA